MQLQSKSKEEASELNHLIAARNYWRKRMKDVRFQDDFAWCALDTFIQAPAAKVKVEAIADPALVDRLGQVAKTEKARKVLLLSALTVLIRKYSQLSETWVLVSDQSEGHLFPVRVDEDFSQPPLQLLQKLAKNYVQDQKYGNYPLARILNKDAEQLISQPVILVDLEGGQHDPDTTGFDQAVRFSFSRGAQLKVAIHFDRARYDQQLIQQFAGHIFSLLSNFLSQKDLSINEINCYTQQEEKVMLEAISGEKIAYSYTQNVGKTFSKVAHEYPDSIALIGDNGQVSYQELEMRSNQLAHFLIEKYGLSKGERVAFLMERSPEMFITIISIIKAGAVFVPMSPAHPQVRKAYQVEDSGAKLLITDSTHYNSLEWANITLLNFEDLDVSNFTSSPVDVKTSISDLVYMIYTSGSTGKPKGVMIEHHSLLNFVDWNRRAYPMNKKDIWALFTNIAFDLTITCVFVPLLSGSAIRIYREDRNDLLLAKVLDEGICNIIKLTPSHLKALKARGLDKVKTKTGLTFIIIGEELERHLAHAIYQHYSRQVLIYNEYGPTEATVGCMMHPYDPSEEYAAVPIGKSMQNGSVYILDEQKKLVVPGVLGEMYISGECVARGYMNRPELTVERFLDDPFVEGARMYRTGDFAQYLPNGDMLFHGRQDDQVKIRGYRIELAEISKELSDHPLLNEAVTVAWKKEDSVSLTSYYIASEVVENQLLRDHLSERLPDYMIPVHFIRIDNIPLTTNGKLDRKALPEHVATTQVVVKPEGSLEEQILKIWAVALNQEAENIDVSARFFHIGGDSLKALAIIRQIEIQIGIKISIRDFFDNASVRMNAQLIAGIKHSDNQTLAPIRVDKRATYKASSAQERMLFERLMNEESLKYNVTMAYYLDEELTIEMIRSVLQKLIQRHETLRTRIFIDNDEIKQQVVNEAPVDFEILESKTFHSISEAYTYFARPFDLYEVPMLRCGLLESQDLGRCLFIGTHHAVADGISLNILMSEFMALSKNEHLPPVSLRYIDYAHWQKSNTGAIVKQEEFWAKQLSGVIPSIHLPIKIDRKSRTQEGKKLYFEKSIAAVNKEASNLEVSSYLLLLTLYTVVMHKFSGDRDIIIGTDGDGRTYAGFSHTVGAFSNILPLRLGVEPQMTLRDLLIQGRTVTLSALDNQDYPFDQMQNLADLPNGKSIIDIYFSFTNFLDERAEYLSAGFTRILPEERAVHARYDLELNVLEMDDQLNFEFIYDQSLFEDATIEQFMEYYNYLLTDVSEKLDLKLSELNGGTVAESDQAAH